PATRRALAVVAAARRQAAKLANATGACRFAARFRTGAIAIAALFRRGAVPIATLLAATTPLAVAPRPGPRGTLSLPLARAIAVARTIARAAARRQRRARVDIGPGMLDDGVELGALLGRQLHARQLALQQPLDARQQRLVVGPHQRDRLAWRAGTAG